MRLPLHGEVPSPVTLIGIYVVVRLISDLAPELAPKASTALKQGAWSTVANVGCSWMLCIVLIRNQFVESKTIVRSLLIPAALTFGLSIFAQEVSKSTAAGADISGLLLPAVALIVTAVEQRFFHHAGVDEGGQLSLSVMCIALTAAQVFVVSHGALPAESALAWVVAGGCAVQGLSAVFAFLLWIRARHLRLNPLQALHRCAETASPAVLLLCLIALAATPSPPVPPRLWRAVVSNSSAPPVVPANLGIVTAGQNGTGEGGGRKVLQLRQDGGARGWGVGGGGGWGLEDGNGRGYVGEGGPGQSLWKKMASVLTGRKERGGGGEAGYVGAEGDEGGESEYREGVEDKESDGEGLRGAGKEGWGGEEGWRDDGEGEVGWREDSIEGGEEEGQGTREGVEGEEGGEGADWWRHEGGSLLERKREEVWRKRREEARQREERERKERTVQEEAQAEVKTLDSGERAKLLAGDATNAGRAGAILDSKLDKVQSANLERVSRTFQGVDESGHPGVKSTEGLGVLGESDEVGVGNGKDETTISEQREGGVAAKMDGTAADRGGREGPDIGDKSKSGVAFKQRKEAQEDQELQDLSRADLVDEDMAADPIFGLWLFGFFGRGLLGTLGNVLVFALVIYGGPCMLQIAECLRLSLYVVVSLLIYSSPESQLGLNGTERALTFVSTFIGATAALRYCRRWHGGWGSLVVPVPAYHLVSLGDLEASVRSHMGNEMQPMQRKGSKESLDRADSIELAPETFTATPSPAASVSKVKTTSGAPTWAAALSSFFSSRAGERLKDKRAGSPLRRDGSPEPGFEAQSQFIGGKLLSHEEQDLLWSWLPMRHRVNEATLIYCSDKNGYNLHTLYHLSAEKIKAQEHRRGAGDTASILLIKTGRKEVIGAFTNVGWQHNEHYFGNGECFVFRIQPTARIKSFHSHHGITFPFNRNPPLATCWKWSQRNDMFMLASNKSLSVGCGDAPALWLDDELSQARSSACETFGSPPLPCEEEVMVIPRTDSVGGSRHVSQTSFRCVAVELYMLL